MRWSDKLCRFRNIRGCVSTSRGSRYSRVRERSIVHRHKSITQTTINQYCSLTLLSATAGGTWDGTDSNNYNKFSYCIAVWHCYYNDLHKFRNQVLCDSLKWFKWIVFFHRLTSSLFWWAVTWMLMLCFSIKIKAYIKVKANWSGRS